MSNHKRLQSPKSCKQPPLSMEVQDCIDNPKIKG